MESPQGSTISFLSLLKIRDSFQKKFTLFHILFPQVESLDLKDLFLSFTVREFGEIERVSPS